MATVDDIWEHAQNTRMWLQTAHDASGRTTSTSPGAFLLSYFSRGSSRRGAAGEILDALAKALAADLAAVDSLIAETEALQRQARTPQSR